MDEPVENPVTQLEAYRRALKDAAWLPESLGNPPWLVKVFVEMDATGEPVVVVLVAKARRAVYVCVPTAVGSTGGKTPVVVRAVQGTDWSR